MAVTGLNRNRNVTAALAAGDSGIFSKSIKNCPEVEKTWLLLDRGRREITLENAKLLCKAKACQDNFSHR